MECWFIFMMLEESLGTQAGVHLIWGPLNIGFTVGVFHYWSVVTSSYCPRGKAEAEYILLSIAVQTKGI